MRRWAFRALGLPVRAYILDISNLDARVLMVQSVRAVRGLGRAGLGASATMDRYIVALERQYGSPGVARGRVGLEVARAVRSSRH